MTAPRIGLALGYALLAAGPSTLVAQDTVVVVRGEAPLSPAARVARRAVDLFNAPATTRVFGRLDVAVDDVYTSDVAVLEGPVLVEGVIKGDLVAINANVALASTAEIAGDVLVLGGALVHRAGADVRGGVERYSGGLEVRRLDGRIELLERPRTTHRRRPTRRYRPSGDADIVLTSGGTYNRVEGLPILLGPRIDWGRSIRGRIEALAVFRTARELEASRKNIGYRVEGSLSFGYDRLLTVGGRAYDVVRPLETWGLRANEVGFGTFLFHRDYRDYYLTEGAAAFVRLAPTRGVTLEGELAFDRETSIGTRDPWTLFRGDDAWRANPTIDAGSFRHLSAALELDSRVSGWAGGFAWWFRGEWERGTSDDVQPRSLPLTVRDPLPAIDYTYDRVALDLRLYQRIGWGGDLRLRGLAAASVGEHPLPVQRRLSLGGPALMPGYAFRSLACNGGVVDLSLPALCDRVLLLQAEYRGGFGLGIVPRHWDDRDWNEWGDWDEWFWFDGPNLVLFADGGVGWLEHEDPGDLQFDVGVGLEFGSFGIYAARALVEDEPIRFSVRLNRRF
ncbi:MAG: hypothetical protein PVF27_01455 [Gemmatimonadales bacterium]|jgi:hypothetical protein